MRKASFVLMLLIAGTGAANSRDPFDAYRPPVDCARYLGKICSNWVLAPWLPSTHTPMKFEGQHATAVSMGDRFLYAAARRSTSVFTPDAPTDGTQFTYGQAGPPKGYAVYDYKRHITFYSQGCCAWGESVLAYAPAPPIVIIHRNLSDLRTERGIRLGMSAGSIESDLWARLGSPRSRPCRFAKTFLSPGALIRHALGAFKLRAVPKLLSAIGPPHHDSTAQRVLKRRIALTLRHRGGTLIR